MTAPTEIAAHPSPVAHAATGHGDCLNCGTHLTGPFCHACGQGVHDYHRSIFHLAWEAIEGFTHLDGRLMQTIPALLFWPGRLARDHIEGRRVRHVPPLRLFLVTLLLAMFVMELAVHHQVEASGEAQQAVVDISGDGGAVQTWLAEHLKNATKSPAYYTALVFEWGHRLAILTLPILAGLLGLLYLGQRRFYMYDHLVVAMLFLSFCFLIWTVTWVLPEPVAGWAQTAGIIWTPINLFMMLRGAYGSGAIGAAFKALFLWGATVAVFCVLIVGLLLLALDQV